MRSSDQAPTFRQRETHHQIEPMMNESLPSHRRGSLQWVIIGGAAAGLWLALTSGGHDQGAAKSRPPQAKPVPTDIQAFGLQALHRIFPVVVARFVYLRLSPPSRPCLWKSVVSVAVPAGWPLILNGILIYVWPATSIHSVRSWATLGVASGADMVMLCAAWTAWAMFISAGGDVDALIGFSPERGEIANWANSRLRVSRQLPILVLAGLVAVWLTYSAHRFAEVRLISYLGEVWFTLIGTSVVYWLIMMAAFIHKLSTCTKLELYWHDPARTPAVVRFCYAYVFVGAALLAGIVTCEAFALFVPVKNGSIILNGLAVVFPAFAALVALYAVVRPYVIIYMLVWRAKKRLLDRVSTLIQDQNLDDSDAEHLEALVNMHQGFRDMSNLPISVANVVQYVTALAATLLAYLLQHALG